MVSWNYFDQFGDIIDKYLPHRGQGTTKASQMVTAINKLIYRFYNDGDVFDNQYYLDSYNDLSSYANWLYKYIEGADDILLTISNCTTNDKYSELLKQLANTFLIEDVIEQYSEPLKGDIYDCDGPFEVTEEYEDDYDDYGDEEY